MGIALLLEDGATASSVATTLDMFRLAQRLRPEGDFLPRLFSAGGGPVRLTDAVSVDTERLPADLGGFDAVLLPGFFAESLDEIVARLGTTWREVVRALRGLPPATLAGASCYGTFVLAEAGLLAGLPATTTWWLAREFQARYPEVRVDADRALVDSGRILTAGAMTAHTDLSLQVLRRLGGVALARGVGGIMLVDGARTSQLPFMSVRRAYGDPLIQRAVCWMTDHLAEPLSIEALSRALHVSYRTLHRRFQGIAGMAPLALLQALRIERAKELLEGTPEDFEAITARVGYGDASSFRRLFKRATSLSPGQYRRRFSGRGGPY